MMSIGLHARISGKPGRFSALREFVDHVAKQEGVWITTRRDVAKHFRENFPYERRRGGNGGRDGRHGHDGRDGRHGHDGRDGRDRDGYVRDGVWAVGDMEVREGPKVSKT